MIAHVLLASCCGVVVLAALAGLGLTLARIAGQAERRIPHPTPHRHALRPTPGIAAINRAMLERWRELGALSSAGYARLRALMDRHANAYPYWSGGEEYGTPCVWAHDRRYTLEEWNTESDGQADAHERGHSA